MAEMLVTPSAAPSVARLLFLHAQTSLHPGSGTALGVVDLPVQRERHTQWPTVPGSALKGIFRDTCREKARARHDGDRRRTNEQDEDLVAAFGPGKVDESSSHAGALSITDARILAYPVRSLRGVFAWVTCPAVLHRLGRDLALTRLPGLKETVPQPGKEQAACAEKSPLLVTGDKLVLEEFEFTRTGAAKEVAAWVAAHAVADKETASRLVSHFVVLNDDDFTHFVRHATEVVARIALHYDRKTVKSGALFYQEFLPTETLFYTVVLAHASRKDGTVRSADQMLAYLRQNLEETPVVQIGGDETTGKGLCGVRLSDAREVQS
jgi:CRISPR-associated protein Cmr4